MKKELANGHNQADFFYLIINKYEVKYLTKYDIDFEMQEECKKFSHVREKITTSPHGIICQCLDV